MQDKDPDMDQDNQRFRIYDWSTLMVQLAVAREEWRCCTMGHGVQFVMTVGLTVMPELLAGMKAFITNIARGS